MQRKLILLMVALLIWVALGSAQTDSAAFSYSHSAIIRGNTTQKRLALVFTGGDFNDGGWHIQSVLKQTDTPASFFFTGDFYRNPTNEQLIIALHKDGHYLGAHSDKHLLYCTWEKRDSLLVTKSEFLTDLANNYREMSRFGVQKHAAPFFLPPYEWYNDTIASWTKEYGLQLINYTPGTLSHTDYTIPSEKNYRSTDQIFQSITAYEQKEATGLNGFILLLHIGTHPERTDKFYTRLADLISHLKSKGYRFVRIDQLLD